MNIKTFCMARGIAYQEWNVTDSMVHKFYEITNPGREQIVGIPDGCIDIQCVWKSGRQDISVCGSFVEGAVSKTGTYERCIGIKFNPGVVLECFQGRMEEIVNSRCKLELLFRDTEQLLEIMRMELKLQEKAQILLRALRGRTIMQQHALVPYMIQQIQVARGYINIGELVDSSGYSQRYTERIFKESIGFSVKKYAGIIRMQNALNMLADGEDNFGEIYEELGYYDQAHFIHEFKKFTMLTPYAYKNSAQEIVIV